MPRTMVRLASLSILLVGVAAFAQQPAAPPKDPKEKKAEQAPQPGSLEDLLSQALRNNPDIRVAEAKVREAEAELQRTRIATAQKMAVLHASIEIARKARDEAEQRFRTTQRLYQTGKGLESEEGMRTAKLAWERAIHEVVKLESEMPALLGKLPGKLGEDNKAQAGSAATQRAIHWLQLMQLVEQDHIPFPDEIGWYPPAEALVGSLRAREAAPKGTMAERIRKALDTPINGDYKGKPIAEIIKDFEKKLDGIAFRVAISPIPDRQMDINLGQVPLGSAIQAINDIIPDHRFVVRDYGILFTRKDWLPPGALLLHDFWKSDAGKDKPKGEGRGAPEGKNPPPGELQGSVKAVDDTSGLVTITIGSDAGLAKGHTLEAYRLGTVKTGPKYLGTVRILEVRPSEAVAKPVGRLHEAIQTGDSIASKIPDK